MNAITRIACATSTQKIIKKTPTSFQGKIELNETKKPLYAMGAGLIALGIANLALISNAIAGRNRNLETMDGFKRTITSISNDVTKLQQLAANQSPDKAKIRSNIVSTQAMIEGLIKKIKASKTKGLESKYEEIAAQLLSLETKLNSVRDSVDFTVNTQKLTETVEEFKKEASLLSSKLTPLRPEIICATDKMGLPVDKVTFAKDGAGARTADGKPFEGTMSFKLFDHKTAKVSTVDVATDSEGKIIRSVRRDQNGNMVFDKEFSRIDDIADDKIISATKVITVDAEGLIERTVQTREKSLSGKTESVVVSKTAQNGSKIYQKSLFAKSDGASKLLETTSDGKARLLIHGLSDDLKQAFKKIGLQVDDVDKIDIVLNKPFSYKVNKQCKHARAYEIEDIFSGKIRNAVAYVEAMIKSAIDSIEKK